jgi:hypothetical protein
MESIVKTELLAVVEISQRRREIFERTTAKFSAAGFKLNDPEYIALFERWIQGEIAMATAASAWDDIKKRRVLRTKAHPSDYAGVDLDSLPKMTQEQIVAEIAKLTE